MSAYKPAVLANKMLIVKIGFSSYIAVSLYIGSKGETQTECHSHQYPSIGAVVEAWMTIRPELSTFDFEYKELYELLDTSSLVTAISVN